jgi:hypothetical protein
MYNFFPSKEASIMKVWLLVSAAILLLYGCAEVKYVKAGATQADFEAAKVDCHNQILMSSSGANLTQAQMASPGRRAIATPSTSATARQDVGQCLQSKGWIRETESK